MNAPADTKVGVNGSAVYTAEGVGDARVALYTSLVRGCETGFIRGQVEAIRRMGEQADGSVPLRDAFVMAFQTRDVRGGKGERDVAYDMLVELAAGECVKSAEAITRLLVEYGCWRDLFVLYRRKSTDGKQPFLEPVKRLVGEQLEKDEADMKAGRSISLLAKWMPREGRLIAGAGSRHVMDDFAGVTFEDSKTKRNYKRMVLRKRVSALNNHLKTVEIAMCGGQWATIQPGAVPGRALKKYRAAFLNEDISRHRKGQERSSKEDRRVCAEHFKEHLAAGKAVKGGSTVFPHEVIRDIQRASGPEEQLLESQWSAIREATVKAGGLRRTVALADFSGSMSGLPILVSMALGILISEVNHPAFRDYLMTFDSTPSWISLVGAKSLKAKIDRCKQAPWGTSTDFEAAFDLLLNRMVEHKVPVGEEPEDLLVLTDMGWDAASNRTPTWETHIDVMKRKFATASECVFGTGQPGWTMPRIIVWNLSARFKDYHATAQTPGVIQLSGWSPSTLKVLQEGKIATPTPYESMRAVLDDPRYDAVRTEYANIRA